MTPPKTHAMRTFMKTTAFVIALLLLPAIAQANDPRAMFSAKVTHIDDISLNAAAATRTFNLSNAQGYKLLVLTFNLSARASSTDVGLTCAVSDDGGTTKAELQDCSVSSGACTSSDASWSKTVSGVKVWPWRVNVLGFKWIECVITSTAAGAGDKLTVTGHLTTG